MEQLKEELSQAFSLVSSIPVSGDSVEIMVMVKNHLRSAYQLAEQAQEQEKTKEKPGKKAEEKNG